jgi:MFS superfamily sulfate permease-like transporter
MTTFGANTKASTPRPTWASTIAREAIAGAVSAVTVLSIALAAGLLAYAPLGPEFAARGAAAGLLAAIVGGLATALAAPSSFIMTGPRSNLALVQAGLAVVLLGREPFTSNPTLVLMAVSVCLLLAGVAQIALSLLRLDRIIRFVPHPVLAGFLNGVSLLIALGAFHLVVRGTTSDLGVVSGLGFAAILTTLILYLERRKVRFPPAIAGLLVGTAIFYALRGLVPELPLGPTVGHVAIDLRSMMTLAGGPQDYAALANQAPQILLSSLIIALVATLDGVLIGRVARNLQPTARSGPRFLVGQGLGNVMAGIVGGTPISGIPGTTVAVFHAGGRTRLVGIASALLLLLLVAGFPGILSGIPLVAVCAGLFANSIRVVDTWSVGLVRHAIRRTGRNRTIVWKNLAVIVAVMAVTATTSVTAGVVAGVVMSCVIFIVDMSRPLVRRRERGDVVFSRRVRTERDVEILRGSGHRRIVLNLQGVMFFGNTDDLCTEIETLFGEADIILLDFRRVADIDVSAVGALEQAMAKARARKKLLLFCSVPAPHVALFAEESRPAASPALFVDRDTALEWMEETALHEAGRSEFEEVPLEEVEFLDGLLKSEIEVVRRYLLPMSFPAGTILCRQGEDADYLWILSSGSVSLLLEKADGQPGRRIASLARGTVVGEMTFLAGGTRSETIRADENVTGYMVDRETFDTLLRDHPSLGGKLLANIGRDMARRVRATYSAFEEGTG